MTGALAARSEAGLARGVLLLAAVAGLVGAALLGWRAVRAARDCVVIDDGAGDWTVVRLRGRVHRGNARRVARRLITAVEGEPAIVEIDLARVTTLHRAGTWAFFEAARVSRQRGVALVLTCPTHQVHTMLRSVGLPRLVRVIGGARPTAGAGGPRWLRSRWRRLARRAPRRR
ncbi:STAS domain-containing protein [Streptomyces sp. DSM 44915]|uniref:STAS domain-containing protein n=1 Tax=Streptomyces chisholmiae TaxID=3075540 RepID=A0ABU2JV48_9ACTN|nr:STAS domain-containing protein [Streptomyces sp. DSM 44915]MDT0268618.1 STAS domain-containing protein [Streptomyces sp. DSM 44915]